MTRSIMVGIELLEIVAIASASQAMLSRTGW